MVHVSKRLWAMISVGAVLTLMAVLYIQLFLARPIGSGPAGPSVVRMRFGPPGRIGQFIWLVSAIVSRQVSALALRSYFF